MRKNKFINKKGVILLIAFIMTISPLLLSSFANQGQARLKQAGLNANLGTVLEINENRTFCTHYLPKVVCYASANKILFNSRSLFYRYITTFSPNYLFMTGDKNEKYINVDHFGLLPIISLPFYFFGFIYLWSLFIEKRLSKNELFLVLSLIVTPFPSLFVGDPQKIRLSALLPFLIILIMYGFRHLEKYLKKHINYIIYVAVVTLLILFSLFFMINFLTVHVQKYEISYSTYVHKLMNYLGSFNKKTSIYIGSITESPILYAYVNKIDPTIFQKLAIRKQPDSIGFTHIINLGNLHVTERNIEEIYCQTIKNNWQTLYITNEDLVKIGRIKKATKIIRSENNVDTLAFVYDVKDIDKINIDCSYINENR